MKESTKLKRLKDIKVKYEHVTLEEAWEELSYTAFGVWVRMQNLGDVSMDIGQQRMAEFFGFNRNRFYELMRELERKGYIQLIPGGRFQKTKMILMRHCIIYGNNTFVKLSGVKEMQFEDYVARFNYVTKFGTGE